MNFGKFLKLRDVFTYLLIKHYFVLLEVVEIILEFLELSLLLQSAFHCTFSVLNETAKNARDY